MRIIKKVVPDTFVSVYAWTCEKCTSEMEAEQNDINCLNDGKTVKLYVACPVCSYTHDVEQDKMTAGTADIVIASAPVFVDPQVLSEQLKAQLVDEATAKLLDAVNAAAVEIGADPQVILDGLNSG